MPSTRVEYDFRSLEEKGTKEWERTNEFEFIDNGQEKRKYILDMFPYPSGAGLHVGHLKGYLATDILSRMLTMQGHLVFHPMGWDAFGLPAEQYAIKTGNSPSSFTQENIDNFRKQLRRLMLSYDFKREVNTSDPNYFKHTQWIFSQLYRHGLAEMRDVPVNWCEELNTVLSDEEILEDEKGRRISERGGYEVTRRVMKQWILKITEFAEELLKDIEDLEGPENIKQIQKNGIGRNERYPIELSHDSKKYSLNLKHLSSIRKLKGIGMFLDSQGLPPRVRSELFDLDLPVTPMNSPNPLYGDISPIFEENQSEEDFFDESQEKEYVEKFRVETRVSYRLRDWVFSRQRFWGEPIPILHDPEDEDSMVLDEELPVTLPDTVDYKSKRYGKSPLVNDREWMEVNRNGRKYLRETNTMPNWAGSSGYFIAYLLKKSDGTYLELDSQESRRILERGLPVDIYVGGQEHATMHLLYARFWHKFLHRLGLVKTKEPFRCLFNQGLVLGSDGQKMSKSKGNYVSIDEMVDEYGADALRVYEAFSGPTQLCFTWDEKGIVGSHKGLSRVHSLFFNGLGGMERMEVGDGELSQLENKLIENVSSAIPQMKVNVGVSEMMIFINGLVKLNRYSDKALESFVKVLSLYAPALAEEIWRNCLGKTTSLFRSSGPLLNILENQREEYRVFLDGRFRFALELEKDDLGMEDKVREELDKRGVSQEDISLNRDKKVIIVRTRR